MWWSILEKSFSQTSASIQKVRCSYLKEFGKVEFANQAIKNKHLNDVIKTSGHLSARRRNDC